MTTPASNRPSRKRAADFTGKQTEQLNEAKKADRAEQAAHMAMTVAQEVELKNTVIDIETGEPVNDVEIREVEATSPTRTIRVNQDINQMTWGREVWDAGDMEANPPRAPIMGPLKTYDFEEGQPYRVPVDVAEHLNHLGYLSYLGA